MYFYQENFHMMTKSEMKFYAIKSTRMTIITLQEKQAVYGNDAPGSSSVKQQGKFVKILKKHFS